MRTLSNNAQQYKQFFNVYEGEDYTQEASEIIGLLDTLTSLLGHKNRLQVENINGVQCFFLFYHCSRNGMNPRIKKFTKYDELKDFLTTLIAVWGFICR